MKTRASMVHRLGRGGATILLALAAAGCGAPASDEDGAPLGQAQQAFSGNWNASWGASTDSDLNMGYVNPRTCCPHRG
jgi:hypothetical protein